MKTFLENDGLISLALFLGIDESFPPFLFVDVLLVVKLDEDEVFELVLVEVALLVAPEFLTLADDAAAARLLVTLSRSEVVFCSIFLPF